ncbi:hypothetical protein BKA93DRAFT_825271 [Sparassis latifolia]
MPLNSLTRQAGIRIGPLLLETLVKHYLERIVKEHGDHITQLRQDELLYDEAFNIIKTFMEAATKHTIEELQEFSNTYVPSSPWSHVVRLRVPMSCCDDAATFLIQALGGEETTKRIVGGTKWWQVRGIKGIDAEWITAKKDYQEAKRRDEAHRKGNSERARGEDSVEGQDGPAVYGPEMDAMRCILFAHGGGYYFGSIAQERYGIQRYARKINGRVFTINYRLSPQYPFPCAIHDLLAAYLFLIRPPEDASHRPVDPAHIVVAGDSAGGGLCIALLQILRDTGLPMPAGGVLISPWCDLTHSFPSIHINTATDVIPQYGLSFHKPSTLWPSPPEEYSAEMESMRSRILHALRRGYSRDAAPPAVDEGGHTPCRNHEFAVGQTGQTLHLGSTASLPTPGAAQRGQTISLRTTDGQVLTVHDQVHMYTTNDLLVHPLVSPALSYLGGLPPLLVIASEKEVLRDEIIYSAHKAAYPSRYHVNEEARKLYPPLKNIEQRFGPTKVHLQVYDDAAHTLPVLFSFTTPAKYCFRAIATFCKFVTGLPLVQPFAMDLPSPIAIPSSPDSVSEATHSGEDLRRPSPQVFRSNSSPTMRSHKLHEPHSPQGTEGQDTNPPSRGSLHTFRRRMKHPSLFFRSHDAHDSRSSRSDSMEPTDTGDVAGPRFGVRSPSHEDDGLRRAGEPSVYSNGLDTMIRERVSTLGVIRPLEPEDALTALQYPEELVGVISELTMRRYFDARAKFDKKFAKTTRSIDKKRRRNFNRAKNDTLKNMTQLQNFFGQEEHRAADATAKGVGEGLVLTGSLPWAWALDLDEKPPPSSIVSRRDTEEARRLAKIADQAVLSESSVSGNNLWSLIVDFLTVVPDEDAHKHKHKDKRHEGQEAATMQEKHRSKFAWFDSKHRKAEGALKATSSREG